MARLEVRGLDVDGESPLEARAEPVLQGGDGLGRAIAGEHDLAVSGVQRVKGVEKFGLRSFLSRDELDVVDKENVLIK